MSDRVRAGIVGTGFMGTVHARAVRRAGGVGRRASSGRPRSPRAPEPSASGPSSPPTPSRSCSPPTTSTSSTSARPNATARPAGPGGDRRGQARRLREAAGRRRRPRPRSWSGSPAAAGVTATVPFVYRFYPMVREARAGVADGTSGPVRLLHGSLPAGLARRGRRRRLAGRRRGRWRLPGVRRHRRALVRPRRVRVRPPHHPGRRPHRRRGARARRPAGDDRGRRRRAVRDRPRARPAT